MELLPGTLDLLILRTLRGGAQHGYGIAQHLKLVSDDVLEVGESSLYPALQRLLLNGRVKAEWGASENNRRARYYTLTAAGRKQLERERQDFERMIGAIQKVLLRTCGGLRHRPPRVAPATKLSLRREPARSSGVFVRRLHFGRSRDCRELHSRPPRRAHRSRDHPSARIATPGCKSSRTAP
jgi:PadR family transcriptional regulator, regulatory protein PadR